MNPMLRGKSGLALCFTIVFIIHVSLGISFGKNEINIIPEPKSIEILDGSIQFDKLMITYDNNSLLELKSYLEKLLWDQFKISTITERQGEGKRLLLELASGFIQEEAYALKVSTENIKIIASDPHGVFNGIQSFIQLLYAGKSPTGIYEIKQCRINDAPRFDWRGFMLDESRHFYGKEKVKQTLDLMALHKLNIFHWHLTDAPGWRIEIKKYPKLIEIGSVGNQTDPNAPATYYTQQEIEEIVAYAAERYIQVIPEIDMPGHLSAAMLAYPVYSGGGTKRYPNFTINPGKEESYQFLTDILKEISILFPAPYIHIGGDEVSFGNKEWSTDTHVIQLKKDNNLTDLKSVEHYFIRRMYDSVVSLNKKFVGWDEIANTKVGVEESVVMWWRHKHQDVLMNLIQHDYNIILCPRIPMYLDFDQDESHKFGRRWQGEYCDLEKVYKFPDELNINIENAKIQGIQGNLWTNRISSEQSFDFMTWPRLTAIAEAGWTKQEQKDYTYFLQKLKGMMQVYDAYGLYYFDYFNPSTRDEPDGSGPPRWQENHLKAIK